MDFAIAFGNFAADLTWEPVTSIANNVWLSLNIRRGSFFAAPNFGHRLHLLKKNTPQAADLAEQYVKEALQWLIDTGRATSVEAAAQRDPVNHPNRLLIRGTVVQADGRRIPFEHFVEVA